MIHLILKTRNILMLMISLASISFLGCQTPSLELSLKPGELTSSVFEIGAAFHFTDNCTFILECDCCLGELLLNEDSTFVNINYCMGNKSLFFGNFTVLKDSLTLHYSGQKIDCKYNEGREVDPSKESYVVSEKMLPTFELKYAIKRCQQKIKLISKKQNEFGITSTRTTRTEFLEIVNIPKLQSTKQ